ncbi:hypothetical protein TeGR_g5104 [Tetraparma gracilis]|uniref:START domain-containing protein n=1 Tax=Tetraparma gracilis TaxID=2962635 RepID=A0ABQ6N1F1_9STRA|nr:hypothetical protein TeGR_g5104 [Tetraparma gracilis]
MDPPPPPLSDAPPLFRTVTPQAPFWDPALPVTTSEALLSSFRQQEGPSSLTKSATLRIHLSPSSLSYLLQTGLGLLYSGRLPPTPSGPLVPPPLGALVLQRTLGTGLTRLKTKHELATSLSVGNGAESESAVIVFGPPDTGKPPPERAVFGSFELAPRPHGSTSLTMTAKGHATPGHYDQAHLLLDDLLGLLPILFGLTERAAEIDAAELEELAAYFRTSPLPPTPAENVTIESACADADKPWRRIPGTVLSPVALFQFVSAKDLPWGKAVADIDASPEMILAFLWNFMSYERVKIHRSEGAKLRLGVPVPGSHTTFQAIGAQLGPTIDDRIAAVRFTWRKEGSGYLATVTPAAQEHSGGSSEIQNRFMAAVEAERIATKAVMADFNGLYRITRRAANVSRVTLVGTGNPKGKIPKFVLDRTVVWSLNMLVTLHDKHERNGKEVDAELRANFPRPPALEQLGEDARKIFDVCTAMEGELTEWTPLKSPSPYVKMSSKLSPRTQEQRSLALGRAEAILDCSAEEACAWWFPYDGREASRAQRERGNKAGFIVRENTAHDHLFASINTLPFPLTDREVVGRVVAAVDAAGNALIACESTADVVDYGANFKTVPCYAKALARFERINDSQCKVVQINFFEPGGNIPAWILNANVGDILLNTVKVRDVFQRDDEVDELERDELAGIIELEQQVYDDEEEQCIADVQNKLGGLKEEDLKELDSPDHLVQMSVAFKEGGSTGILRGSTIIDASIAHCAAFEVSKMSRENVRAGILGNVERSFSKINNHQNIFQTVTDFNIPRLIPRELLSRIIWRWEDGRSELVSVLDDVTLDNYPEREEYLRMTCSSKMEYKRMENVGGFPQTRVTMTSQTDVGGVIPKWVQTRQGVGVLMYLSRMRKLFDKSLEIDAASNLRLMTMIQNHVEPYAEEEEAILRDGVAHFSKFDALKSKELKMASLTTKAKMALEDGDRHAWGWATTTVKASPERVLAFLWDAFSRANTYADTLESTELEAPNDHHRLAYARKAIPSPFREREVLSKMLWLRRGDGSYVYVTAPGSSDQKPVGSDFVRGTVNSAAKLTPAADGCTKLEYMLKADPGGHIPAWIVNAGMVRQMQYATDIKDYFQSLRGLEMWGGGDGEAVGEVLVTKTDAEMKHGKGETRVEARVRAMMEKHKGLKELGEKHEWIKALLAKVVANKLRPAGDSKAKLCNMSVKQANIIGGALASCIAANLTAPAAVDEWILRYPAMRELEREYMLIVLSGIAPGIHAKRVADGNEQAEHAAISPDMELTCTRCFELVCESIPGSVLQLATLIQEASKDGEISMVALGSIIMSACTTGFTAATISFDFDVGPQRRRDEPDFYGYIPDSAGRRTAIFFCMIMNGALLLLLRSLSTALLLIVDGRLVLYYYLGDHVSYLAYKIARRDLYHWLPLEGAAMIAESVFDRIAIKAITDFTGVVQFRGAGEMGGAGWVFSQVTALVASLVATHIYLSGDGVGAGGDEIRESVVWTIAGALSGSQVLFFACFLLLMKPAYRSTFFSTQTGYAWVQSYFVSGQTDEVKKNIHEFNKKQWQSIRPDVKAWTLENWDRWEDEKPAWFNDAWKMSVDDDMIPPASLRKMNGGERRRSSLGELLGGSARRRSSAGNTVVPVNNSYR